MSQLCSVYLLAKLVKSLRICPKTRLYISHASQLQTLCLSSLLVLEKPCRRCVCCEDFCLRVKGLFAAFDFLLGLCLQAQTLS